MKLYQLTLAQAHQLLRRREISSVELTHAVLDRISAVDGAIKAYLLVTPEQALQQAAEADKRLAQGEEIAPLTGVPGAIKDNMCTAGVPTTCGSRILANFIPPYDATAVRRLKEAGAVIVGKTNLDEFAMGSSTENSAFFPTRNPWDLSRVPGGSSGGSAAAVAADAAIYALGSDTGGSVRLPGSFCGVVGLKPTYGRVSRYGLVAYASSLDQIGPITKDVADSALVLNAIAGYDPNDSTTLNLPVPDYTQSLVADIRGLRVGVPKEYFAEGTDPQVERVVRQAVAKLAELGALAEETSLPHTKYGVAAYYIIAPAEASANLARYDGVKYGFSAQGQDMWDALAQTRGQGFGPEVRRRIMLGTYALSAGYYDAYYLTAQKTRTLIKGDFEAAFAHFDVLATPTCPTTAFQLGEKLEDPLAMYLSDVCTLTINMAGIPALVVPCGFADGLPVGLQILAPHFREELLLRVAYAYEQATEWRLRKPESID